MMSVRIERVDDLSLDESGKFRIDHSRSLNKIMYHIEFISCHSS